MNSKIKLQDYYKQTLELVNSEKFLVVFSLQPFLWTWLPVLSFRGNLPEVKKSSIISGIMTVYFFAFLALSFVLSFIPVYGGLIANVVHLSGILLYFGYLSYMILMKYYGKSCSTALVDFYYKKLDMLL